MNSFASGETMKEWSKISATDVLCNVYGRLATVTNKVNKVFKKEEEEKFEEVVY
jgi:hypothetical protein